MEQTNITIHQAFYGEVERSHGCITSTLYDDDLKSFLTAFTDRPTSIPAGIELKPYYSGSIHSNNYIFTLTFPDKNASRGGMVFTHALIVSLDEISKLNDLTNLFSLFVQTPPDDKSKANLSTVSISIIQKSHSLSQFPKYIQQTVEKLIANETPILFCGKLEVFKNTIFTVWKGLSFSFRKKLSFIAGFTSDTIDTSKTIIFFQKNLIGLLKNLQFISDENKEVVTITSEAEQYILKANENNSFESFLNNLDVAPTDWSLLSSCVKAFHLYSKIDNNISAAELRLLARAIDKIAPDKNNGKEIKIVIIQKVHNFISTGKDTNIKALRNFPVSSFIQGEDNVASAIDSLLSKTFTNNLPLDVNATADLCLLAAQSQDRNWWHETATLSIKKMGREKTDDVVKNFWKILTYNEKYISSVLSFIPAETEYERTFVNNLPAKLGTNISKELAKEMSTRKWFLLHAHLLLNYLTVTEAILMQIRTEHPQNCHSSGIPFLLSKLTDAELLDLVLSENKEVLTLELGQRTVFKPTLLERLDVSKPTWLNIWSVSLENTKNIHHGIKDLPSTINDVLNLIRDDNEVHDNIVECIADSPFADIANYPFRKEVWQKLQIQYKPKFLKATAIGYIEKLIAGSLTDCDLEHDLHSEISNDQFVTSFLKKHHNDFSKVITFYENVNSLKDNFLADYIQYYSFSLTEIESSRLGNFVQSNKFSLSAWQIFEKAKYNGSFKIALNLCKPLLQLNFIDRLLYGNLLGERISEDSVYDALFEFSKHAYYQGPEDRDIWKRAGGAESKLVNHRSREENWRNALNLLRYGGGGKHITTKSLVKEMLNDFPNSTELKEIKKYI